MKRRWQFRTAILLLAFALLVGTVVVVAQSDDSLSSSVQEGYNLGWTTVDAGGYTFSTGGNFALGGTTGQPDAGLLIGGDFALGGGFWGGGALRLVQQNVYLPLIVRNR
jgi:hypothetical protein